MRPGCQSSRSDITDYIALPHHVTDFDGTFAHVQVLRFVGTVVANLDKLAITVCKARFRKLFHHQRQELGFRWEQRNLFQGGLSCASARGEIAS